MWRRRANRLLFSFLASLVIVPVALVVVATVAIKGADAIPVLLAMAGLPAVIALDIATRRMRSLPEPCLPPYPNERDHAASPASG